MGRRKSRQAIAAANAAKRRTFRTKLSDQAERTSSEEYDISSMDDVIRLMLILTTNFLFLYFEMLISRSPNSVELTKKTLDKH